MTIFSSRSSNLTVVLVRKLENFAKISVLKPPFSMKICSQVRSQAPLSWQLLRSQPPKFGNAGRTYLPGKKLSAPPQPDSSPHPFECQILLLLKQKYSTKTQIKRSACSIFDCGSIHDLSWYPLPVILLLDKHMFVCQFVCHHYCDVQM